VLFVVLRVVFAVLIGAAVTGQLVQSLRFDATSGSPDAAFTVINFVSFFTIESNVASVAVLTVGALFLLRAPRRPDVFDTVRASVVSYMVVTGVVYNLLLRGIELPQGQTLAWSNEVLHVIGPAYLLVDWLLAPDRIPLGARRLWSIAAFPLVWAVYTLVRGELVADPRRGGGWYPYPFLNPDLSANGYLSVAFYVVLITLVILSVGAGVLWVSRRGRASHGPDASKGAASSGSASR